MLITIGQAGAPHGVKGEFRLHPVTDFPERFTRTREVYLVLDGRTRAGGGAAGDADETARKYRVHEARPAGGGPAAGAGAAGGPWIMSLEGVTTREEAAALRGALLKVPQEELTPLPEGRFYLFQVVGLNAVTEDGRPVGTVVDVLKYQANDVYVVRPEAAGSGTDGGTGGTGGGKQADYLVPAIHQAVAEIDVKGGRLVLRRHPAEDEARNDH